MKLLKVIYESALSILPVVVIILFLSLIQLTPLGGSWNYVLLAIGTLVLILGLAIFNVGSSRSITKVGEYMGTSLSKQANLWVVILVAFLLGALITCAEPDIMILAELTPFNNWTLIIVISLGVGIFVALGVVRVFKRQSLKWWIIVLYGIVFCFCLLIDGNSQSQYMPLIFDSSGATTGSATVPFLLSLGSGVAMARAGKKAKEESFGLIAIASVGPIISMTIMFLLNTSDVTGTYELGAQTLSNDTSMFTSFFTNLVPTIQNGVMTEYGTLLEVAVALVPILVVFLVYQSIFIKLPKNEILRILLGFLCAYIGLVLFLDAVNVVMMPVGILIGQELGTQHEAIIILVFFCVGLVTILCEPAIHALTKQIEAISDGGIKKSSVLITLSLGVGCAVGLSAIRAIYDFSIAYYIVPGFVIAIALSFFCPPLFSALAFDSGGVASGPMSVSFLLPLNIGMTAAYNNTDLEDLQKSYVLQRCFGTVALVALTPIIAIQILGIVIDYKKRHREYLFAKHLYSDNEVIHF